MDPSSAKIVRSAFRVAQEAEEARSLSPEQRAVRMRAALRAAVKLLKAREDRRRVLDLRDPLPESSLQALARLRASHRRGAPSRPTRGTGEARDGA